MAAKSISSIERAGALTELARTMQEDLATMSDRLGRHRETAVRDGRHKDSLLARVLESAIEDVLSAVTAQVAMRLDQALADEEAPTVPEVRARHAR